MSNYRLICGDALTALRTLPSDSVSMCCTSPPYYGLRSYLPDGHPDKAAELGGEDTPEQYVARLVEVFREVRRVLHPSGVLFLNIGDSYNGSGGYYPDSPSNKAGSLSSRQDDGSGTKTQGLRSVAGLKPKDLIGIPWMVAFALRADGWWLRSEIIWAKTAPMPESVTDRPTKSHEQVFLLAKSREYFFDNIAIAEPLQEDTYRRSGDRWNTNRLNVGGSLARGELVETNMNVMGSRFAPANGRNKRSVWTLGPEQFQGAHYAVMPTKLVEPCVLAGSSAYGACAKCGSPYERIAESERVWTEKDRGTTNKNHHAAPQSAARTGNARMGNFSTTTLGWGATCQCGADIKPCVVLDPFFGSGTVAAVALKHGRNFIGIDLDARNIELARTRIERSQPMLLEVTP